MIDNNVPSDFTLGDIFLRLLLIEVIVCFIVDCSGFIISLKSFILKMLHLPKSRPQDLPLKPFDCSLCMTWWTGLIYLLVTGSFSIISLAILSMLALLSSNVSGILLTIKDLLAWLECKLRPRI